MTGSGVGVKRVKLELQNLVEKHHEPLAMARRELKESKRGWRELRRSSSEWQRPESRAEQGTMARKRNGVERRGKKLLLLDAVV
jgi:hypothetical protein